MIIVGIAIGVFGNTKQPGDCGRWDIVIPLLCGISTWACDFGAHGLHRSGDKLLTSSERSPRFSMLGDLGQKLGHRSDPGRVVADRSRADDHGHAVLP